MPTVFDFETTVENDGVIPKAICCAIQQDHRAATLMLPIDAIHALQRAIRAGDVLIAHHAPFDIAVLLKSAAALLPARDAGILRDEVWTHLNNGLISCTRVRSLLISIGDGSIQDIRPVSHALDAVVMRLLGSDISGGKKGPDSWRLRYGELDGVPLDEYPAEAREYPLSDASVTMKVWREQARVGGLPVEAHGLLRDEASQVRAAWCLYLMSMNGICADGEAVERLAKTVDQELARSEHIERAAGLLVIGGTKNAPRETRPKAPMQARVAAAYAKMGLDVPLTDKGAVSTSAETLEGVTEAADPVLYQLAQIGTVYGTVSKTFLPALRSAVTAPVHPRWSVLVASGRVSCANPNLTNQPRLEGVRECWIPQPGATFIEADYSFIELCTLAQVCIDFFGFSKLADSINAMLDPHLVTAAGLLRISYEEARSRLVNKDPVVKKARQTAKAINFGLPGGMGAASFAQYAMSSGVDMGDSPVELANTYKEVWLETYPEMRLYLKKAGVLAKGSRIEQVRSGRIRSASDGGRYSAYANTFFQGLAADGMKRALWYVTMEMYTGRSPLWTQPRLSPLARSRMVAAIHDELLAESPTDKAPEAAERLGVLMVAGMREYTPDVRIAAEPLIMNRWYKAAEPIRVNGRLVPWEPR